MKIQAIVTAPPYADFLSEVAAHPLVRGLRLNTVMPLKEGPGEALDRLGKLGIPLWVDLKGRQLRVVGCAVPPFTEVTVSHKIQVPVPADVYFRDGKDHARLVEVDGERLILAAGPRRVIGPGESINIVHPDLSIQGTLTGQDKAYLRAMQERGLGRVMLSYVEREADVAEILELLPGAEVVLKIESVRGLDLARRHGASLGQLMAARGDLYVEVPQPHRIVGALRDLIKADPGAIAASRLFPSLAWEPVPRASEITDVAFLISLGYRTFMLGDEVCLKRETVMEALSLLEAVSSEFPE
mgnify:CR=1 FL=1